MINLLLEENGADLAALLLAQAGIPPVNDQYIINKFEVDISKIVIQDANSTFILNVELAIKNEECN